jgi:hypothetical protein
MRLKQRDQKQDHLALLARRRKWKAQSVVEIKALSNHWATKLAALDEVIRLTEPVGDQINTQKAQRLTNQILRSTTELVSDAVSKTRGEFTISTIAELINQLPAQKVKKRQLRTALWRLIKQRKIAVLREGTGQTQSVYAVTTRSNQDTETLP